MTMRNEEDKKNQPNDNLDELMKVASQRVEEEKDVAASEKKENKSTKKVVLLTSGGLVLFAGIVLSGALLMNNPQEFVDKTETPDWVENEDGGKESDGYNPWEFDKPIELNSWAEIPYNQSTFWAQDGIEKDLLEISKEYQGFYFSIARTKSGIPHGYDDEQLAGPYTNDVEKRYLEDGSVNEDFSYALTEDYEKAYVTYTERLVNPLFGDWSKVQSSDDLEIKSNMQFNALKDMFTSEWWNNNIEESRDYSNLPIFAEWTQGDWDKFNIDKSEENVNMYGTFYGEIEETEDKLIQSEQIGVDQEGQAIMKVSSPVTYSAFGQDGENVEVHGTLELTLESNSESTDVKNRIVISDAELKLEE